MIGSTGEGAVPSELVVGKYRLVRLLGRGGMGAVYEARHEVIGRRVALKFMHADLAGREEVLARFRREAQAAGGLESENVAAVTDFGVAEDGSPFIVMEYLQGEDLARLLARTGPLPVARAVDVLVQTCRGLTAAHANDIVHRDLKPENLFLLKRGDGTDWVKILDFGIAKLRVEGDASSSTRTGVMMGTPYYMPPEQARGQKDIDHRADVYALGVILYELLSGTKPHPGDSYNAILFHVLTQTPARLETLRPNLPAGLADIVHRAMAAQASDRFQTVADLSAALEGYRASILPPVPARVTPIPLSVTTETAMAATERAPSLPASSATIDPLAQRSQLESSPRRSRGLAPLALVGVVALAIAAYHFRGSEAGDPAVRGAASGVASTPNPTANPAPSNVVQAMPAASVAAVPGLPVSPSVSASGSPAASTPAFKPKPSPVARPQRSATTEHSKPEDPYAP